MSRRRLVVAAATVAVALASLGMASAPASAHPWGDYCQTGHGLLLVWQDEGFGGLWDFECSSSDSDWGDSSGDIRSFNDRMTSFHAKDRNGDGVYTCFIMYQHISFGGWYFPASNTRQSGGFEVQNSNVGELNDSVSSSVITVYAAGGLCPSS